VDPLPDPDPPDPPEPEDELASGPPSRVLDKLELLHAKASVPRIGTTTEPSPKVQGVFIDNPPRGPDSTDAHGQGYS
jgi:hypothetical protein